METVQAVQLKCVTEKALRNDLIVERILSFLPSNSKDLFNMRLVNHYMNTLSKREIQKRGDYLVHLANNKEINNFMEFLEKNYPDLDNFSPYSFKLPMGDIDKDVLETFATKVGSRIKILDLYEGYNNKQYTKDPAKYPEEQCLSQDYTNFGNEVATPSNPEAFLVATRTMPKIWALLKTVSDSLRELSLTLCSEVIRFSGKFPEQIPRFQRLKKLNLIYGGKVFLNYDYWNFDHENDVEDVDWGELWNGDPDDKFFKNFVEKAKNMTSGHIVARKVGYSRIFAEIGSIKFENGGRPTLELLEGKFGVPQIPFIRNLINQNYSHRITNLDLQLCSFIRMNRTRATSNHFLEFLHLLYDFILTQSQSLEILIITIEDEEFASVDWVNNLDFNPPLPAQALIFSKLKRFQLKPDRGQHYKFLKGFFRGNFPVIQELYPFYDSDDATYIEVPNVTMPKELLETTRKNLSSNDGSG